MAAHTEPAPPGPPDSQYRGLVSLLPARARPYALLARFDRPIGWWLLFLPCAWGVALAGGTISHWWLYPVLMIGAIAMRGAGCVYNDIVDRDVDARVARTASRPLASGAVSVRAAATWLGALCLVGLAVLFSLNDFAKLVALASLALVGAYPFMKRITGWPQAWLGLVFSWGALVGWAAVSGSLPTASVLLYIGTAFWVMGYDTIYALQDREDDALIGIGSSALSLGANVRFGVLALYLTAIAFWLMAFNHARQDWIALIALAPAALHLIAQVAGLDARTGSNALDLFRSNRNAGLLVLFAAIAVGSAG